MFTPERRQFLVDALGEDKVRELEEKTENLADYLKSIGIEFKALDMSDISVDDLNSVVENVGVVIEKAIAIKETIEDHDKKLKELNRIVDEYAEKVGWIPEVMGEKAKSDGRLECSI